MEYQSRILYNYGILKRFGERYKLVLFKAFPQEWQQEKGEKGTVNDEKIMCNIARARSKIFEYSMCNAWTYFVTLTFDRKKIDRYDLPLIQKTFYKWLSNYNSRNKTQIKYLLIPEQHKDGAWHMHGFFEGIPPRDLIENAHGYLDWPAYFKKFGYISLEPVRDKNRASSYITKYVSKDMAESNQKVGAHLYYCSKGLELAEVIKKDIAGGSAMSWDWDYQSEYTKIKWFEDAGAALSLFD